MKSIKTKLSNLKNRIEDTIPDEEDLLGFEGVSRAIILQAINETYGILDLLIDYQGKLEGVLLQRTLADLHNQANHYLKEKFKNQDPKDFNDFLYAIGKMHYETQETYLLCTKDPIRLDIHLARARETLKELENQNEVIQPLLEKLEGIHNSTTSLFDGLTNKNDENIKKTQQIDSSLANILSIKKKTDSSYNAISKNEELAETAKKSIVETQQQAELLFTKNEQISNSLQKNKTEIEAMLSALNTSIATNTEHQQKIQATIDDASRAGMASSFKKRKDELGKPYWFWSIATILTIGGMIGFSFSILELIKDIKFNYEHLLIRLPILGGFIWLGWFCAKQFGFVSRIREDYSYKYAVSLAFEGYKKEAREVDENMLANLLSLTIGNISSSPLNIFDSATNHGTPVNEMVSGWKNWKKSTTPGSQKKQETEKDDENEEPQEL